MRLVEVLEGACLVMELVVVFHCLIWEGKMGVLYLGYVTLVNHSCMFTYDCYVGLCILHTCSHSMLS
jgi:hypothetical protein